MEGLDFRGFIHSFSSFVVSCSLSLVVLIVQSFATSHSLSLPTFVFLYFFIVSSHQLELLGIKKA